MQLKTRLSQENSATLNLNDYDFFKSCLVEYGKCNLFKDTEEWLLEDNPYRRTLRPHIFQYLDFSKPLTRDNLLTYNSLTANRTLLTVYESSFLFLPKHDFGHKRQDFVNFYDPKVITLGNIIRPWLEHYIFSFLDTEISVTGNWTATALEEYFQEYIETVKNTKHNQVMEAIEGSTDPVHAAKTFLIQLAGDFLVESSAMSRNILGYYGSLQSELFKIVIDEYGYGIHQTKHSKLFEETLTSVGLESTPHTYWQFYLTSSLMLNNYYNYICADHSKFFRYLGAIFYAETTFIKFCELAAKTMEKIFGSTINNRYFLEHVGIDHHHSRMVLENLIKPAISTYGEGIIPDIVRGFEEAKLLSEIADQDFIDQVHWADDGLKYKALALPVYGKIQDGSINPKMQQFIEPRGELSVTHVHDGDELCYIQSGVMKFVTGHNRYTILNAGEGTVIQHNRLHGAIIESEECVYNIYSIGDYQKCLS
ncbi:MAG: iron-containing redox enzyme family protein [Calothrix sp. MO_167.B12]|nr:iron-containing redox enzyme family protein [Calothrix sp. MO_167.B12]